MPKRLWLTRRPIRQTPRLGHPQLPTWVGNDRLRVMERAAYRAKGDVAGTAFWETVAALAVACQSLATGVDTRPQVVADALDLAEALSAQLPAVAVPTDAPPHFDAATLTSLLMTHAHVLYTLFHATPDAPDATSELAASVAELVDLLTRWSDDPGIGDRIRAEARGIDLTDRQTPP